MNLKIGDLKLPGRVLLAPMAGITDPPFRAVCREFGAALTYGEMLSSDQGLWTTSKSRRRQVQESEFGPRVVQLAGAEPQTVAEAARASADQGAALIDINMGCPAKKVCNRLCGSALLADESLVARILEAAVRAVKVPVTVKIRTGPDPQRRNGVEIARLAERCGVSAIAVHGRTRTDLFRGDAEYETIRDIKAAVRIPVIANGDIRTVQQAQAVLAFTGADAVMIGRGAQGSPWIFRDVNAYLSEGIFLAPLLRERITEIILLHLESMYAFYGEQTGIRMARKHLGWYCQLHSDGSELRRELMAAADSASQFATAQMGFGRWVAAHQAAA
jgi:tRNA-dihydrouridine synthase B